MIFYENAEQATAELGTDPSATVPVVFIDREAQREALQDADREFSTSESRAKDVRQITDLSRIAQVAAQTVVSTAIEATGRKAVCLEVTGEVFAIPPFDSEDELAVVRGAIFSGIDTLKLTPARRYFSLLPGITIT